MYGYRKDHSKEIHSAPGLSAGSQMPVSQPVCLYRLMRRHFRWHNSIRSKLLITSIISWVLTSLINLRQISTSTASFTQPLFSWALATMYGVHLSPLQALVDLSQCLIQEILIYIRSRTHACAEQCRCPFTLWQFQALCDISILDGLSLFKCINNPG